MVNPQKAIQTIDSLLQRIEDISKKEYDEKTTMREFAGIVIDTLRFVRLSIKGIKERYWYPDYVEFTYWSEDGIRIGGNLFNESKKDENTWKIGEIYEYDINKLKVILNDCRKDFEMLKEMKSNNISKPEKKKENFVKTLLPIVGKWSIENEVVKYLGPDDVNSESPYGIALFKENMKNGTVKTTVKFEKEGGRIARIVYGYDNRSKSYYSIGIGGYNYAYVVDAFRLTNRGPVWRGLALEGKLPSVIKPNKEYTLELSVVGLKIILKVNGIKIHEYNLPEPPGDYQLGIFTWGKGGAVFKDIIVEPINPMAFVIMRFHEPYNTIYNEIIKKICKNNGIDVYRVDEVYKPGVILDDIIKGIKDSEFLIAEVTPGNNVENVYYEVGYAHALGKQTILLAKKGSKLPFDIQGYRVIFYDDLDGEGKVNLENEIIRHISSIVRLS